MNRPRIVLDTNVLVSAALKPRGLSAMVVNLIALGAVELCLSQEIMAEYREVLKRPKFAAIPVVEVGNLLTMIQTSATVVRPTLRLNISKHESDNRFYECAAEASADYIVTGNTKHFTKHYHNTRVITGRQLLAVLKIHSAQ